MPFITEEIWQRLPHQGDSLMIAPWPQLEEQELPVDSAAVAQFEAMQGLVRALWPRTPRRTSAAYHP